MTDLRPTGRFLCLALVSVLLAGSVGAYAASATVAGSTNTAHGGEYLANDGYFSASGMSYDVVDAAQPASPSALAWANGGIAYVNALVPGEWEVAWTLTINDGATANHVYTITLTNTSSTGTTGVLYTFEFTSPVVIANGQTMTILWNTGEATWTSPIAAEITVG